MARLISKFLAYEVVECAMNGMPFSQFLQCSVCIGFIRWVWVLAWLHEASPVNHNAWLLLRTL